MARLLRTYIVTALLMLPVDAVWLTVTADPIYRAQLRHLLREAFLLGPAVGFYLLYMLGILILAQLPAGCWRGAMWRGAVLGLTAYGTYDLTNQATLRDWPSVITLIDLVWGTMLTATVSALGFRLGRPKG